MTFNNRKLTAVEMQLYKQNKCICCGQEVKATTFYQPEFECIRCFKVRTRVHEEEFFLCDPYRDAADCSNI